MLNKVLPNSIINSITIVFQAVIPKIYLQTVLERTDASPLIGIPLMTLGSGGSVESARAAKVSMIKLIQRS